MAAPTNADPGLTPHSGPSQGRFRSSTDMFTNMQVLAWFPCSTTLVQNIVQRSIGYTLIPGVIRVEVEVSEN